MEIICPTAWCRPNHQEGSRTLTHMNSSTRAGIRAPKNCIKTNFRNFDGVGWRVTSLYRGNELRRKIHNQFQRSSSIQVRNISQKFEKLRWGPTNHISSQSKLQQITARHVKIWFSAMQKTTQESVMCFDIAERCTIVFHTTNSRVFTTSTLLRQLIFHHEDSVRDPQTL